MAEVESAITDQLNQLLDDGPKEDEVRRSQTTVEADFAYRLQTVGEFGGRSDQLNAYNVYVNDPGYFSADLARYLDTDAGAVRSAAQLYLTSRARVALSVVPVGRESVALQDSVRVHVT